MAQPQPREPETTWGFVRALIQAAAGVAFVLEQMPMIGVFLFAVSACTVVYESVQWQRARRRRAPEPRRSAAPSRPRVSRGARAARWSPR